MPCSLCHAYLLEDDDVVYCPVCGAPHHRECYNSVGHCALEENHGTDMQYDKLKRKQEAQEQETQKEQPRTENGEKFGAFGSFADFQGTLPFDLLGGIPKDQLIDDGVTAGEAAKFVASNSHRYVPKFAKGRKVSFNLMAFLCPCGWFLSRKMYKNGIIAGVLQIVASLLIIPFSRLLNNLGITNAETYADMAQNILDNLHNIDFTLLLASFIGTQIYYAVKILSGLFGDYLYKRHTVNTIREIKESSSDKDYDFLKKGGVSLLLFLVGFLAVEILPGIIASQL